MSNPRRLRVWEHKVLEDTFNTASQFEKHINELLTKTKTPISAIPPSLVPTATLLNLVACYTAMYNLLLVEDLIKSGNVKSSKNIH